MSLRRTLAEIADSTVSIPWHAWLAFVLSADDDPSGLGSAWLELDQEMRTRLLTRLALDAGPLADALVQLLGERISTEPDPLLRETLHQDAAEAAERTTDRLTSLRDRLATAALPSLDDQLSLAAEISELVAERERLQAELAGDPEWQHKTELEQELARLRAFRTSLIAYDRPGREAERAQLQAETDSLAAVRSAVEHGIREAQDAHAAARESITVQESQLSAERANLQQARERSESLIAETRDAAQVTRHLQQEIGDLETKLAQERAEISRLNSEIRHNEDLLVTASTDKEDLQRRVGDLLPEWSRIRQELADVVQRYAAACAAAEQDLLHTKAVHADLLTQLEMITTSTRPLRSREPSNAAPEVEDTPTESAGSGAKRQEPGRFSSAISSVMRRKDR